MTPRLYWDLETASLPLDQLLPIMPEFSPAKNLKDPDKIKADLEEKKQGWLDGCALKATTGRIIAFSMALNDDEPQFHCTPDERTMLDVLDYQLREVIGQGGTCFAWNGHGFDLPFFCQRCAAHNIPAFKTFLQPFRGRYSWNEAFVDPMQVWAGPYQRTDGCSLKAVAFTLGVGLKSGSGKDFAKLLQDDPVAAREYSLADVSLLRSVVLRMGL